MRATRAPAARGSRASPIPAAARSPSPPRSSSDARTPLPHFAGEAIGSPMTGFRLLGGVVHCEDVPLPLIAREVGTPVYVYSAASMRGQARCLKAALAPLGDPLVAYAVKANPNPAVVATLAREGLGADVVSAGEYACARAAG